MASTAQPIMTGVGSGVATDLYTAFVAGGATRAMVVSLDFCNTADLDLTFSAWAEPAAGSLATFLVASGVVPARATLSWRGMLTLDASSEKLRAAATGLGIDCLGTAIENA